MVLRSNHRTSSQQTKRMRAIRTLFVTAALLECGNLTAQSLPDRFLDLVRVPGVAGYEVDVRDVVRAQLPPWAVPKVDEIGNLIVTIGSGSPHVALVASLDEAGYVVSRITDDGFLRLHRHTVPASHGLEDQFFIGQPVLVRTSTGKLVSGVTATPSVHLDGLIDPAELARLRTVGDLWVDVGAATAEEAESLGIRLLDAVSLRDRVQPLAGGRVAGVAAQARAGAQALVEIVRAFSSAPIVTGTVTLAWVSQTQFGTRGLSRLAQEVRPDRVYLAGPTVAREFPPGWEDAAIEVTSVPALFPETPVEVVDTRDVASLALRLAALAGLKPTPSNAIGITAGPAATTSSSSGPTTSNIVLEQLVELYGVSGHESPVRDALLSLLPSWARPRLTRRATSRSPSAAEAGSCSSWHTWTKSGSRWPEFATMGAPGSGREVGCSCPSTKRTPCSCTHQAGRYQPSCRRARSIQPPPPRSLT